jgi:predicted dehydrogenase
MRIFLTNSYLSIDFGERRASVARRGEDPQQSIAIEPIEVAAGDALMNEVGAFARAVCQGRTAPVSGEEARHALALALRIGKLMHGKGA